MTWFVRARRLRDAAAAVLLCVVSGCAAPSTVLGGNDPIHTPTAPAPSRHLLPVSPQSKDDAAELASFVTSAALQLGPWASFTLDESQTVVVGTNDDGAVLVWSRQEPSPKPWRVPRIVGAYPAATLSADGSRLAVMNQDRSLIAIWDVRTHHRVTEIVSEKDESILQIQFESDQSFFVTSSAGDVSHSVVSFAHFGPQGRDRVISTGPYWLPTGSDPLVAAVNAETGQLVTASGSNNVTLGEHDHTGYSAWRPGVPVEQVDPGCDTDGGAVASDGRYFACAIDSTTILVWDVTRRTELTRWRLPEDVKGPPVFFAHARALAVEEDVALADHKVQPTLTLYDIASHAVIGTQEVEPALADSAPVLRPLASGAALVYARPRPSESTSIYYAFPTPAL